MLRYPPKAPLGRLLSVARRRLVFCATLACSAALAGGCASHGHPAAKHSAAQKPACYPCGPCAGYFPTCWKMWPDACPSCPIDGGEGFVTAPLLEEAVPLPPTGEEIIRPYDEPRPEQMPLSPADGGSPDADLPKTPGDLNAPDDGTLPGDRTRLDDQGRGHRQGLMHRQRPASELRTAIAAFAAPTAFAGEWQDPPLPGGPPANAANRIRRPSGRRPDNATQSPELEKPAVEGAGFVGP